MHTIAESCFNYLQVSIQVVKRKESSYLETKVTLDAAIKRAETGFPWKGIWHALIDIASTDVYNYECRSGAAHRLTIC